MKKGIIFKTVVLVMALGLALISGRANADESKKEVLAKHMTGEVSGISANFLGLVYNVDQKEQTSYEMAFSLDKDVKVEAKAGLSEISPGDIVSVAYDETLETDDQGNKRVMQRLVKRIAYLKPSADKLEEAKREEKANAEAQVTAAEEKKEIWDLIKK